MLPQTLQYRSTSPHTAQLYGPQSVIHSKPDAPSVSEVRLSSLSPSARNFTLVFTVLLPYFQSKLDSHYTELTSPLYTDPLAASPPPPLSSRQQLFVAVYPYCHAVLEAVRLFYQCRYLFELSAFFLPSHRWTSQAPPPTECRGPAEAHSVQCSSRPPRLWHSSKPGLPSAHFGSARSAASVVEPSSADD